MKEFFAQFNPFHIPSPKERMARDLERAYHGLLDAEQAENYAKSLVAYNKAEIARLTKQLGDKE